MFRFSPRDKVIDLKYFPPLLEMATKQGVALPLLLEGTQLSRAELSLDDHKISAAQANALLNNIAQYCPPLTALDYGACLNLSAFGVVGFAALSSPTARDAISIAHRYMPVVLPLLSINVHEQGHWAYIKLDITYPLDSDAERILLETALSSLYTMASFVLQENLPRLQLHTRRPELPYYQTFLEGLNVDYHGDCQYNQIVIPVSALDQAMPLANQGAFNSSLKQCDDLLEALPTLDRSLSAGIQKRLLYQEEELPLTQEQVAQELFMSVRTMHRLLQREGTNFREIANEAIAIRAKRLLEGSQLSVSQIALELGYSDLANFSRAFRRQVGVTPSHYRQALKPDKF
jgi:AraC-like DNA-binding protein